MVPVRDVCVGIIPNANSPKINTAAPPDVPKKEPDVPEKKPSNTDKSS
jgi:hypothetical protein